MSQQTLLYIVAISAAVIIILLCWDEIVDIYNNFFEENEE